MSSGTLALDELSVVLAATHHDPTVLNPDFLARKGIVPEGWELSEPPFCTVAAAQVRYAQGVGVLATSDRLIVSQGRLVEGQRFAAPEIAMRYMRQVPEVPFHSVGLNPSGRIRLVGAAAKDVDFEHRVLASVDALKVGGIHPRAAVRLRYDLPGVLCTVSVQQIEGENGGELALEGNLHHTQDETCEDGSRVELLCQWLQRWEEHLDLFGAVANGIAELVAGR